MDWQEQLLAMRQQMGSADQSEETVDLQPSTDETNPARHPRVDIFLERKGRAGKTATFISGFQLDDDQLRQLASRLKSKLGVGGSARGGEILLQGDYRRQAAQLLTELGYKNRII